MEAMVSFIKMGASSPQTLHEGSKGQDRFLHNQEQLSPSLSLSSLKHQGHYKYVSQSYIYILIICYDMLCM